MYPGMLLWWQRSRSRAASEAQVGAGCHGGAQSGAAAGMGYGPQRASRFEASAEGCGEGGGHFGVRRPLRFLAYKLQLDEAQVAEMARILDELKIERAQAEVDGRRSLAAFADALDGATWNGARAEEGATLRVHSAERLREAVVTALSRIHGLLRSEQRAAFAYLIRTGTLSI